MGNKKLNYSPKSAKAVVIDEAPENPLTYEVDGGTVDESYLGNLIRRITGEGDQKIYGLSALSGIQDEDGQSNLTVDVWGSLTVVQQAGAGDVLAISDANGNVLGWKTQNGKWVMGYADPLVLDYQGSDNLEQSVVNIVSYDNVTFSNGQATLSVSADEFTKLNTLDGVVVKITDSQGLVYTLARTVTVDGASCAFGGILEDSVMYAVFEKEGNAITGSAVVFGLASANVALDPEDTYPELSSLEVKGDVYKVLTSAEAATIAQQYGYTPTYATDTQVDLLFLSSTLANNSWPTIGAAIDANLAGNYWSLGDTKTDVGTDNVVRTMRICDMSGMYGKKVVFEQVELEQTSVAWDTNNVNNYSTSTMRSTTLPALLAKYSSDLQAFITNTTYKVATDGNSSTLLELTDKLFLPAEREIFASRNGSRTEEWDALSRFALYAVSANDNDDFRKKYKPSTPTSADFWWLRSPRSGGTDGVCYVSSSGASSDRSANGSNRIAPCFSR